MRATASVVLLVIIAQGDDGSLGGMAGLLGGILGALVVNFLGDNVPYKLNVGLLGGLLGALLGLGGGVFGTYCSLKNTRTAAERRFMARFSVGVWAAVALLVLVPTALGLYGLIPAWSQWALFASLFVLGVPLTLWANRRLAALRRAGGPDAAA